MADKEIYKEKVIIHDDHANGYVPAGSSHEEIIHHEPERIVHEHIIRDERPAARPKRRYWRAREEISAFRHGVYLILDIVEVILIAEFFVKFFALNPYNPLVQIIDGLSYPLLVPFAGLYTPVAPYLVINWSILVAMVVYALIAYLVIALFESSVRSNYRR